MDNERDSIKEIQELCADKNARYLIIRLPESGAAEALEQIYQAVEGSGVEGAFIVATKDLVISDGE